MFKERRRVRFGRVALDVADGRAWSERAELVQAFDMYCDGNIIANWFKAAPQSLIGIVHRREALCKPSQSSLMAASSEGKAARVFVILRRVDQSDSMTLVV